MMFPLDNNKAGYVWNPKWVLPYESLWGVTEKFMYLNCLSSFNSKKFPVKSRAVLDYQSDYQNYIYHSSLGYDPREFPNFFGINTDEHYVFIDIFSGNNLEDYIDNKIRICPECIKQGYHSYRHQLLFEDTCFLHAKELIRTEGPYCMLSLHHAPYEAIAENKELILPSSDLLLQLIQEKTYFEPKLKQIQDIIHIDIINLNSNLVAQQHNKNIFYSYLNTIFHCSDIKKSKGRTLTIIDKNKADSDWKNYGYKYQSDSYNRGNFSWFSDFCYNYSQELYQKCNEKIFSKTLADFRSSYVLEKLRNIYYDYDFEAIAIIITVSILTGYSYGEDKRDIFSEKWNRREYFCFCESLFLEKIQQCTENYLKIAYLELYKYIVSTVYSIVKSNADAGYFSKKNCYQVSTELELPIYLVIKKIDTIEIVEIPNS